MAKLTENDIKVIFPTLNKIKPVKIGGQKQVYFVEDNLGGESVLKILLDINNLERLDREVEAVKLLNSENIPKVKQKGKKTYQGEEYYFILEQKLDGDDLRSLLIAGKKFTTKEVLNCLDTLLKITVEMEKVGIVHRDINPNNVIIDSSGKTWLIDFGISRHLKMASITKTSQNYGPCTPGYSPPEQFRNIKKNIDSRADLFGVGVTIYELLSGDNPLTKGAQNPLEIFQRTETIIFPNLVIPGDTQNQLAGFIGTLIDKFLSRRPRSASEAYAWYQAIKPTLLIN